MSKTSYGFTIDEDQIEPLTMALIERRSRLSELSRALTNYECPMFDGEDSETSRQLYAQVKHLDALLAFVKALRIKSGITPRLAKRASK